MGNKQALLGKSADYQMIRTMLSDCLASGFSEAETKPLLYSSDYVLRRKTEAGHLTLQGARLSSVFTPGSKSDRQRVF